MSHRRAALARWLVGAAAPEVIAVFKEPPRDPRRLKYGESLPPAARVEILRDAEEHHQGLHALHSDPIDGVEV